MIVATGVISCCLAFNTGYFSYKWAEVLSADAFSAFEEAGLEDDSAVATTGRKFRDTVLSLGGSVAPADVFKVCRAWKGFDRPRHCDTVRDTVLSGAASLHLHLGFVVQVLSPGGRITRHASCNMNCLCHPSMSALFW